MIQVKLYGRKECHLCEQALADLQSLESEIPHQVLEIDVDSSTDLLEAYGLEVPVVEIGPYRLKAPFTRQELHMTLLAYRDREQHIEAIQNLHSGEGDGRYREWNKADGFSYWFSRHYLAMLNILVAIYLGATFLAPVFMKANLPAPAILIYRAYSMVCHQLPFRSFFLFGEQAVYPRAAAGLAGLKTFQQATGMSEGGTAEELYAAKTFIGNEQLGYKIALCQRDIGIYGGILLFGLVYSLTGRRFPPLAWYLWILFALVPIGVDGVSQLISQPPFDLLPYRESTPYFRVLTGGLFGWMTAWFGYPVVEETMAETRAVMGEKRARIRAIFEKNKGQAG